MGTIERHVADVVVPGLGGICQVYGITKASQPWSWVDRSDSYCPLVQPAEMAPDSTMLMVQV